MTLVHKGSETGTDAHTYKDPTSEPLEPLNCLTAGMGLESDLLL